MNYELCKALKDAGFPQGGWENPLSFYWSTYDGGASETKPELICSHECNFGFMERLWAAPTLEELIEACGDGYFQLEHTELEWVASHHLGETVKVGLTPAEAIARLWLALNKKTDGN